MKKIELKKCGWKMSLIDERCSLCDKHEKNLRAGIILRDGIIVRDIIRA